MNSFIQFLESNWWWITIIIGIVFGFIYIFFSKWLHRKSKEIKKISTQKLKTELIFPMDYKYIDDIYIQTEIDKKLKSWHETEKKPLLIRGKIGIGKTRAVFEFLKKSNKKSIWLYPWDLSEKDIPNMDDGFVIIDNLHLFKDYEMSIYNLLSNKKIQIIATIPNEKYDSNWDLLSNFKEINVKKWNMDCGKNLAKRLEKKFLEEDFDGTPLSVIAPASLMKKSYLYGNKNEKGLLNTIKIIKKYVDSPIQFEVIKEITLSINNVDEIKINALFNKIQEIWCVNEKDCFSLRDGYEDYITYEPPVEDLYILKEVVFKTKYKISGHFFHNLGLAFSNIKKWELALECFENTKGKEGMAYGFSLLNRVHPLIALKRYKEAHQCIDKVISTGIEWGPVWMVKELIYKNEGNLEMAIECLDNAIEIDPKTTEAWYMEKGALLSKLNRDKEAIKTYNMGLKNVSNKYWLYFNKGNSLSKLKRYHEAKTNYIKAFKINKTHNACYSIALNYGRLGMIENKKEFHLKAIQYYNKAIEINPESVTAHQNMGVEMMVFGKFDEAMNFFKKTLQLDPQHELAWVSAASIFVRRGEYTKAIDFLEKALDINKNLKNMIINDNLFKQLLDNKKFISIINKER